MDEDSRLTTAWNCMIHLVTTLIVKFYYFKEIFLNGKCYKFSSLMSNLSKIRFIGHVFARNEKNFAKRSIVLLCEANV